MAEKRSKMPRGIRNHNPGNIEKGAKWQGLVDLVAGVGDPRFAQFKDPTWGIRALATVLITYQDKYKIRSIDSIIRRWAPQGENDANSYIAQVSRMTGFGARQVLDLHTYEHLAPVVEAIIRHENGEGPLRDTSNTWYTRATIDTGLQRAGVVKESVEVGPVPVTKETVAATGTAAIGGVQIVDLAPTIIAAVQNQQDQLSSGEYVKIAIAVGTIGFAIFIAYSQVKKHQQGVVA